MKLFVVDLISSVFDIFLISANFSAVKSINDGSFFLPLLGTGAKNGLSVSIKILSIGKNLKVSCNSIEFLNYYFYNYLKYQKFQPQHF